MATKRTTAPAKGSASDDAATPVAEVIKAKKLPAKKPAKDEEKSPRTSKSAKKVQKPAKTTKKNHRKPAPPKKPVVTAEDFEKWFYEQPSNIFVQLTTGWNEANLKVKIKKQPNYDAWLNYFKALSPSTIRLLARTGQDILPTEAYAALALWHDIIGNPSRIAKIHQAGLTSPTGSKHNIVDMALKNDRYGVLCATRDKLAEKLEKGAGSRDTAALARELTEVMTQIADYEKRQGPKKTTLLGSLLDDMPGVKSKRPTYPGGGSRKTSFKSRVTIEDLEA